MSQYDELDSMILKRIKESANGVSYTKMCSGIVGREAYRLAQLAGRATDDVLRGRLQRLRHVGAIKHSRKWGWQPCDS